MNSTNLSLKVVAYKFERVVKGMDRGQLNLLRGLFFAGTVNDRSEDFVGTEGENLGFLEDRYWCGTRN